MDLGGAEVHAWVELVAQGMIDQHDNLWPTQINMASSGLNHGGEEGNILELGRVF